MLFLDILLALYNWSFFFRFIFWCAIFFAIHSFSLHCFYVQVFFFPFIYVTPFHIFKLHLSLKAQQKISFFFTNQNLQTNFKNELPKRLQNLIVSLFHKVINAPHMVMLLTKVSQNFTC